MNETKFKTAKQELFGDGGTGESIGVGEARFVKCWYRMYKLPKIELVNNLASIIAKKSHEIVFH